MIKDTYLYNGIKAININNLPEEAWDIIAGEGEASEIVQLYENSAFFRRCVDLRANTLSRLPRDIVNSQGDIVEEADIPYMDDLSKLIFQIESAMVLFGYAYLFVEQNRVTPLDLRWLKPTSIKPQFDRVGGLVGFERLLKNSKIQLEVEDLIYFWVPPIDGELGPGSPVGEAALRAATVLEGTTLFSKGFFDRGAVFPMLLTVEGNPSREDLDVLKSWWQRLTRGVKDAWNTIVVRANVKPQIIGPPISDMAMADINAIQRENVATALGIPHSLVLSNASNFAVAQQDYINFYDMTILPEAELIAAAINEQFLAPLSLELVFQPSRLEVFQQANLETSDKVMGLVNSNVITIDEARDILGYEPLDEPIEADEPIIMELPAPVPTEDMRAVDLDKWRRKSIKSFRADSPASVPFESEHISYSETVKLMNELSLCFSQSEIDATFREHSN